MLDRSEIEQNDGASTVSFQLQQTMLKRQDHWNLDASQRLPGVVLERDDRRRSLDTRRPRGKLIEELPMSSMNAVKDPHNADRRAQIGPEFGPKVRVFGNPEKPHASWYCSSNDARSALILMRSAGVMRSKKSTPSR